MASGIRRRDLAQQELESSEPMSEGEESGNTKYKLGARVLCYEPDPTKAKVLYNARVLDTRETKKRVEGRAIEYLMHFVGWSNNWDCWVEEKSILLDDSTGREIQKRTNRLANRSMKKDDIFRAKVVVTKGKKRHRKFHDSDEDSDNDHVTSTRYSSKDSDISESDCSTSTSTEQSQAKSKPQGKSSQMGHHITLNLPSALKAVLTEDMHKIEHGLLLRLPRSPNVMEILLLYFQEKIQEFPDQQGIYGEIVDGVKVYFDFLVGDQLLYESELHQFRSFFPQKGNKPLLIACSPDYIQYAPITKVEMQTVLKKERATKTTFQVQGTFQKPSRRSSKEKECHTLPSQVYGLEHLARLFVHLPDFMCKAEIPRRYNTLLRSHLQDLLDYITLNLPRYQETQLYEEPRTQTRNK